MVKPFQFTRTPQIYFGNGKINELPALIQKKGNSVLLVTGKSSFMNSVQSDNLLKAFESNRMRYRIVTISMEPSPAMIDEAVVHSKHHQPDVVVAIGGGSVMDAGKAISAMIPLQSTVREYLEGIGTLVHPGDKIPFIAVPTTSGTGSETTKNAVISEIGEFGFKRSLRHDNFIPDVALVDPELTINCPRDITAASGMDCFTQLTEALLSGKSGEYTDALAIEGLKAVKSSLLRCYTDGGDVLARNGMAFAALTSGICLANAGLGVIHGFASSLGGTCDIPHGIICSTLMAKSNEINVRELRKRSGSKDALTKYAMLGRLFLNAKGRTDNYYIDGFIQYLHDLTNRFDFPGLTSYGIEEENIEKICTETDLKNNPVELSLEDLKEILEARFR